MSRLRSLSALTVVVAIAVSLAACTAPVPDPTLRPTPTGEAIRPTPTPTPTPGTEPVPVPTAEPITDANDSLDAVTALVARPEALELVDGRGSVVWSLDYLGSPADAVETVSRVVGREPVEEAIPGGSHQFPAIRHTWDGVLVLIASDYPEDRRAQLSNQLVWPAFSVHFHAKRIRGIELTTEPGAQVGDDWASESSRINPDLWTCSGLAVEHIEYPRDGMSPGRIGVGISERQLDWSVSDQVTAVHAPVSVSDGCA